MSKMHSFEVIRKTVVCGERKRYIAVAAPEDEEVLEALKTAFEMNLAEPILIGDRSKIKRAAECAHFDLTNIQLIHEEDHSNAARIAVEKVRTSVADIIMKGSLTTANFLKAILNKETGVRRGILSHVTVFELRKLSRLLILTDCGINISPSLSEKVQLIENAVQVSKALDIKECRVAVVSALELVNTDIKATVDAAILSKMSDRGQIKGAIVDGPFALDNAISLESAKQKGINSKVAGLADVVLLPNIDAGNIMYKSLVFLAESENAGVVMGASVPVVLTSRADSARTKLNSIALSLLISSKTNMLQMR